MGEAVGRAADRLDLVEVDGLEQVLARREVAIEGADADLRAAGDVLERRRVPSSAKASRAAETSFS